MYSIKSLNIAAGLKAGLLGQVRVMKVFLGTWFHGQLLVETASFGNILIDNLRTHQQYRIASSAILCAKISC